ncbi:hypothetical protein NE237_020948 [Protea cynaroides]|uniref:Disease resistance R13L4/SHOC-2-like LRR domain-containing protein n=1 Tax=Protea cynaroides TaxID=273540 RepID=A0A9Q0K4E4_9MAGN|nr:hypothetical protein NE237_020948 [Protea cynaroides]
MANLVVLDLQSSKLKQCWMKTTKYFPYLKVLNLSNSLKLKCLDFSCIPNLEKLILRHCLKLTALDESIGHLTKLVELDLFHCQMLQYLPNTFGYLTSLRKLVTSKCHFRENLPDSICKFSKLRTLDCSYSPSITSFPNLSNMKHLRELNLSCCQSLNEIRGISQLSKLETLRLWSCKSLTSLPNLSHLKHLRELNLSDCPSLKKIESLEDLESAETINLSGSNNFTRFEMFEVISKDFRNLNICHFYLPDWKVFQNKLLNLQSMMKNSATTEVGHVPNMEIQGVIIHGVYVPCQNFDNYPQVVVDNQSKKFSRKCEAEEISFVSSDKVKDWVIKIPNLVWKSFAECGDFINVSFKTVQPCVWIQVSVHFFTLQEMISYNGKSGPEKEDHHRFIEKDDRFFLTSISAMQETNKLIKSE